MHLNVFRNSKKNLHCPFKSLRSSALILTFNLNENKSNDLLSVDVSP